MLNPSEFFGDIDIYLFDQILKNRFAPEMKILDAGCGGGRNLVYFLRSGFEVFGVDRNHEAIERIRSFAQSIAPENPSENFQVAAVERIPFADESFDVVISSAVLHFAADEQQFDEMLWEMRRVLKPSGMLFTRLASTIGIEDKIEKIAGRRYLLPDGSERFLVDEEMLFAATEKLGATFIELIKTTNVQNLRCMTTWVIRKNAD
ncbi:MAG TPA: class I SAM-dependent methyltransferase [Pyrinomonadaceae bacterium]|nr:class I SAM-dependent methyltransferase [Pyrinomonadaceae bacterium]